MRKVKGSIFIPWVKAIKADKTGSYDDYLTQEDKETLAGLILPSSWYSFETYKPCFNAVSSVFARNNPETVRVWGREYSNQIMGSVYKRAIQYGDPKLAMEQFEYVFKSMFNFAKVDTKTISDKEIVVSIEEYDPDFELCYHLFRGWLEKFIELCLKKEVRSEFLQKTWEGAPFTRIRVAWDA